MNARTRVCIVTFGCCALLPTATAAQTLDLSGYALGVSTWADSGPLGPGGMSLLGRFRVMPTFTSGPDAGRGVRAYPVAEPRRRGCLHHHAGGRGRRGE